MHGSIRDRLEDLLSRKGNAEGLGETAEHLASCDECASQVQLMSSQSEMLKSLRAPEQMTPAPGFYARVMQRIEERAKDSIWSVFIYSPLSKRLAYGSLSLAIALGTYVVTEESLDGHLQGKTVFSSDAHYHAPVVGSPAEQRDAVLANFVLH